MPKQRGKPKTKNLPLSKMYHLIEPGPVVLLTTAAAGRANVMTMSSHVMIDETRPLIGCGIGPWNHSFAALRSSGQCVIAVPAVDIADKVVDIGNCSGDAVDKFQTFGLTAVRASKVKAPRA